ncbi:MAG: hypothetical protein RSF01_09390 [Bacteroidales bacterium]
MKLKRNAVVLIHGIGGPRPMDTLRNFVEGVRDGLKSNNNLQEQKSVIRSKPNKMSVGFETRMLRLSKSRKRAATDFYEFYWAHTMKENKFSDFSDWVFKLLLTRSKNVPDNFKFLWWFLWSFFCLAVVIILGVLFVKPMREYYLWISSLSMIMVIGTVVFRLLKGTFLNFAGDAGRYFTPKACNVESRFEIRRRGIELLTSLQNSDKYDRIILVGHSLGSVIGYDLLRFLWTDVHETFDKSKKIAQPFVKQVNQLTKKLWEEGTIANREKIAREFRYAQHDCFEEYKNLGLKWLISDFITIGSPLCNIDFLSAGKVPFETMVREREYPVCPPLNDESDKAIYFKESVEFLDNKWSVKVLHHAALFGVTRWTNIFFENDIIGGSMERLFGSGVRNISIKNSIPRIFLGGHTKYWTDKIDRRAIREICRALNLKEEDKVKGSK